MTGAETRLAHVVGRFAAEHPDLADPAACHDRCVEVSGRFAAAVLACGLDATVLSGVRMGATPFFPGQQVMLGGHYAVAVGSDVYDWTARQFDPAAPVPLVQPIDEWAATWQPLKKETR